MVETRTRQRTFGPLPGYVVRTREAAENQSNVEDRVSSGIRRGHIRPGAHGPKRVSLQDANVGANMTGA